MKQKVLTFACLCLLLATLACSQGGRLRPRDGAAAATAVPAATRDATVPSAAGAPAADASADALGAELEALLNNLQRQNDAADTLDDLNALGD